LPSVQELRIELAGLKILSKIFRIPEVKDQMDKVSEDLDRVVNIVGKFYDVLGKRNWIFNDSLSIDRIEKILSKPTAEEAERELIAYLQEEKTLDGMLVHLNRFPDMRPRMDILMKAKEDYLAGRYYSSVLVVVSMMDGFVNDALKEERRGLHARKPEEMQADDCVAAVWEGLPSVQKTFTKSVKKRIDKPIYEVYRHAIMHGMATDYDNPVVASKAWCMLFAVADWTEAKTKKQELSEKPADIIESIRRLVDSKRQQPEFESKVKDWHPHEVRLEDPLSQDADFVESCERFFEAWCSRRYDIVGSFFPNYLGKKSSALAGEASAIYAEHPISSFEIIELNRSAPAIGEALVRITSSNKCWTASIRLTRLNGKTPAADWEYGEWKVMQYAVKPFQDVDCD
jgi:hypothetical protein